VKNISAATNECADLVVHQRCKCCVKFAVATDLNCEYLLPDGARRLL